ILTYSLLAAAASQSQAPWQLLLLWFLACTGVGGMWPNGVALLSEAWSGLSRPTVAGLIGTSANVGIFGLATLASQVKVTPERWRWVMIRAAWPAALGLLVLLAGPEPPLWLARRASAQAPTPDLQALVRPPSLLGGELLPITLVAIVLATVPLIGGW